MSKPSIEQLSELFDYDPETGVIHYRRSQGKAKSGSIAGTIHKKGYRHLKYQCRVIKAHQLAWALSHREWPIGQIDHINGIREDNRIINLRLATPSQNAANKRQRADSLSPSKGVSLTRAGKWCAQVGIPGTSGRKRYLGTFHTIEEASAAYAAAARETYGDYARAV